MSEEERKGRIGRLEKEADWLAALLSPADAPYDWRTLASRVVDIEENRWKENWYTL